MNAPLHSMPHQHSKSSIGAILVDAGRLSLDDAERILRLQREAGLRFGDAARRLKLVSDEDIEYALAQQFDYPYLALGQSAIEPSVVAAYAPFSTAVERLRALRSQLLLRGVGAGADDQEARKSIAITSVSRGDGRSWISANLAIVFAQLGHRVLLVDANLRQPGLHRIFGLEDKLGLSSVLAGRAGTEAIQRVADLPGISVLPAGAQPPNPQELLSRPRFAELLAGAKTAWDLVIIDTPAAEDFADAYAVAKQAGTALMVARKDVTHSRSVAALSEGIQNVGASLVGAVVNER